MKIEPYKCGSKVSNMPLDKSGCSDVLSRALFVHFELKMKMLIRCVSSMCMHYAQVYKRSCANLTDDDINGENLGIPTLLINVFQYVLSDAKSLGHMGPQCINSHF